MDKLDLLAGLGIILMLFVAAVTAFSIMVVSFFAMWGSDIHLLIFVLSGWCFVWSAFTFYKFVARGTQT